MYSTTHVSRNTVELVEADRGRTVPLYDTAAWMQPCGRKPYVRWPGLGGHHRHGKDRHLGEKLATPGLDVQRSRGLRQPLPEQALVPPRRSLLGRATREPGSHEQL
jgi:hypothetical protein